MTRISTEPGEYAMWTLDDVYPKDVIDKLAENYGLDRSRLAAVLDEVVADFDDKAPYYYRVQIWHAAKEKALEVLSHLKKAKKSWERATDRVKAVMAEETTADCNAAQFEDDLQQMIVALEDMANVARRQKGENRTSTKLRKGDIPTVPDLTPFDAPSELLFKFWREQKGKLMGHEVEYGHAREIGGKAFAHAVAKSEGLAFLHDCLTRLDDRVTVEQCRTRVRDIKSNLRRA